MQQTAKNAVALARKHPVASGVGAAIVGLWILPKLLAGVALIAALTVGGAAVFWVWSKARKG